MYPNVPNPHLKKATQQWIDLMYGEDHVEEEDETDGVATAGENPQDSEIGHSIFG